MNEETKTEPASTLLPGMKEGVHAVGARQYSGCDASVHHCAQQSGEGE